MRLSNAIRACLLLLVLSGVLSIAGTRAGYAQSRAAVKMVSDTVALASTGVLEVENHRGRVAVTTWERDAVGYGVRIVPPEGDDDTPLTSLDVTREENRLELEPDYPWQFTIPGLVTISPGGPERPRLRYAITMPRSAQLEIDSHSASISVSGVEGGLEIDTHDGGVETAALRGEVSLETHSGPVRIDMTALTAPLAVDTFDGAVRLSLPADAGFELEAELNRADLLTTDEAWTLPAPTDNEYEGPVNGGGPPLTIESFSGIVELRAR